MKKHEKSLKTLKVNEICIEYMQCNKGIRSNRETIEIYEKHEKSLKIDGHGQMAELHKKH